MALARIVCRRLTRYTPEMRAAYEANGYGVLPGAVPTELITRMKARALALVDAWAPEEDHSIFISYKDRQYSDDYFMKSAGNISFFLEEDAQDPDGRLLYPKHESINKIAHALHDRDEVFREYSYSDTIKELLRGVGFIKPMIVQSMYIMKPTRIGGVVYPHQDSTFIQSDPSTCFGIWVAIDDAKEDNACLWGVPGSHKFGTHRYWSRGGERDGQMVMSNETQPSTDGGVCLPADAGTIVYFDGNFVHWSGLNTSARSRHAYTLHVVETHETTWKPENWLQRDDFVVLDLTDLTN